MTEAFPTDENRAAYEERLRLRQARVDAAAMSLARTQAVKRIELEQAEEDKRRARDEALAKAERVKRMARDTVAYVRGAPHNVGSLKMKGALTNPPGRRDYPRVLGRKVWPRISTSPADVVRNKFPKREEHEVWILESTPHKGHRPARGLAIDAEGEFYVINSVHYPETVLDKVGNPLALGVGPQRWQIMYTTNEPAFFTDETVAAWQDYLDDYAIRVTQRQLPRRSS